VCDGSIKLLAEPCPLCAEETGSEGDRLSAVSTTSGEDSGSEEEQLSVSSASAAAKPVRMRLPTPEARSPLCLVLDIDGTMLSEAEGVNTDTMGSMLRPYLQEFLDLAFESFTAVAIWTAANQEWLDAFVAAVDPEGKRPWAFKWSYERVSKRYVDNDPNNDIEAYWKDLRKIWRTKSLREMGFSQHTTLIIDNSPLSCRTCKTNAVFIKTYGVEDDNYAGIEDGDAQGVDDWLLVLMNYLHLLSKRVADVKRPEDNLRQIDKRRWYVETKAVADVDVE